MSPHSFLWYLALVLGVTVVRVLELWFSARHQTRLLAEGATKIQESAYPLMVGVHVVLLLASPLEVWLAPRPFLPWLGWPMLGLLGCCVAGRLWVWRSLGEQWNVQIVQSLRPIIDNGPYRYVRHPNYTIVILEMFALPLVHTAYLTAGFCSVTNALVLWQRIRQEEAALFLHPEYSAKMGAKPRFLPVLRSRSL